MYDNGTTFDFVASIDESYEWRIGVNTMQDTGLMLLDLDYVLDSGGIVYTPGNSFVSLNAFELGMSSCTDPLAGCIDYWIADIWDDDFIFSLTRYGGEIILPSAETENIDAVSSYVQASVPVPAAVWLFGSGLIGLIGIARRKKA